MFSIDQKPQVHHKESEAFLAEYLRDLPSDVYVTLVALLLGKAKEQHEHYLPSEYDRIVGFIKTLGSRFDIYICCHPIHSLPPIGELGDKSYFAGSFWRWCEIDGIVDDDDCLAVCEFINPTIAVRSSRNGLHL